MRNLRRLARPGEGCERVMMPCRLRFYPWLVASGCGEMNNPQSAASIWGKLIDFVGKQKSLFLHKLVGTVFFGVIMSWRIGPTINKKKWRAFRLEVFNERGWRCERCKKAGRLEPHHKKPLHQGGAVSRKRTSLSYAGDAILPSTASTRMNQKKHGENLLRDSTFKGYIVRRGTWKIKKE